MTRVVVGSGLLTSARDDDSRPLLCCRRAARSPRPPAGAYSTNGWSDSLICEAHAASTRVLLSSPSQLGRWHDFAESAGLFANVSCVVAPSRAR